MKTFLFIRDMLVLLAVSTAICASMIALYYWILA